MNRRKFLTTLLGIVAAPAAVALAIKPKKEIGFYFARFEAIPSISEAIQGDWQWINPSEHYGQGSLPGWTMIEDNMPMRYAYDPRPVQDHMDKIFQRVWDDFNRESYRITTKEPV